MRGFSYRGLSLLVGAMLCWLAACQDYQMQEPQRPFPTIAIDQPKGQSPLSLRQILDEQGALKLKIRVQHAEGVRQVRIVASGAFQKTIHKELSGPPKEAKVDASLRLPSTVQADEPLRLTVEAISAGADPARRVLRRLYTLQDDRPPKVQIDLPPLPQGTTCYLSGTLHARLAATDQNGKIAHLLLTTLGEQRQQTQFFPEKAGEVRLFAPLPLLTSSLFGEVELEATATDDAQNKSTSQKVKLCYTRGVELSMSPPSSPINISQKTVDVTIKAREPYVGIKELRLEASGAFEDTPSKFFDPPRQSKSLEEFRFSLKIPQGARVNLPLQLTALAVDPTKDSAGKSRQTRLPPVKLALQDDLPPQAVTITSPIDGSSLSSKETILDVAVEAEDDHSPITTLTIKFKVNGQESPNPPPPYKINNPTKRKIAHTFKNLPLPSLQAKDTLTIEATAFDLALNKKSTTIDLTVSDSTPPTVTLKITEPVGGKVTTGQTVKGTIEASDPDGSQLQSVKIVARFKGSPTPFYSYTPSSPPTGSTFRDAFQFQIPPQATFPGEVEIEATVEDGAGARNKDRKTLTLEDKSKPNVSFLSPTSGSSVQPGATVKVRVRASDNDKIARLEWQAKGPVTLIPPTSITPNNTPISQEFSLTVNNTATSQDNILLTVTATDPSSNEEKATLSLIIGDKEKPVISKAEALLGGQAITEITAGEKFQVRLEAQDRLSGLLETGCTSQNSPVTITNGKDTTPTPPGQVKKSAFDLTVDPKAVVGAQIVLEVYAKDRASPANTAVQTIHLRVKEDSQPPTVALGTLPQQIEARQELTITVTATDSLSLLDKVHLEIDDRGRLVSLEQTPPAPKLSWQATFKYKVPYEPGKTGNLKITVWASDKAQNSSSKQSKTLQVIDQSGPVLRFLEPHHDPSSPSVLAGRSLRILLAAWDDSSELDKITLKVTVGTGKTESLSPSQSRGSGRYRLLEYEYPLQSNDAGKNLILQAEASDRDSAPNNSTLKKTWAILGSDVLQKIEIEPSPLTLRPGQEVVLRVWGTWQVQGVREITHKTKFSSSDPAVATVEDYTGLLTIKATASATAKITASAQQKSTTIDLKVTTSPRVEVFPPRLLLTPGQKAPLELRIDGKPLASGVKFQSQDKSIAQIQNDTTVQAVAKGKTTLRASHGGQTYEVTVFVGGAVTLPAGKTYVAGGQTLEQLTVPNGAILQGWGVEPVQLNVEKDILVEKGGLIRVSGKRAAACLPHLSVAGGGGAAGPGGGGGGAGSQGKTTPLIPGGQGKPAGESRGNAANEPGGQGGSPDTAQTSGGSGGANGASPGNAGGGGGSGGNGGNGGTYDGSATNATGGSKSSASSSALFGGGGGGGGDGADTQTSTKAVSGGGGGGGGVLVLSSTKGSIQIDGHLEARGGNGASCRGTSTGGPGGGGGGGFLYLQVDNNACPLCIIRGQGLLDVRGGQGGSSHSTTSPAPNRGGGGGGGGGYILLQGASEPFLHLLFDGGQGGFHSGTTGQDGSNASPGTRSP